MKRLFLLLPLLLFGCSPKLDGRSTVERYLKAIQNGDKQGQKALYCVGEDAIAKDNPLQSAPSWSVIGEEQRQTETTPQYPYKLVTVKVGDRDHQLEVWQTDAIYQHEQLMFADLKQKGIAVENLTQESAKWSQQSICVRVAS